MNDSGTGLAVPANTSIAQMVAEAAPLSAHVVKAFFTLFQVVLAKGQPFDVSFAGADERAKVGVAEFVETSSCARSTSVAGQRWK